MENRMNMPVDVICYGQREHFETRQEAKDKYAEAMTACEGAEQERYVKIYLALAHGTAGVVTDGFPEKVESKPSFKFTAGDKEKIIALIEAGELSINSREIYDYGKGKLVLEDRDIIKALLKKDGWYAAQSLRKYIENDKELLLLAARGGDEPRGTLAYACEQLQDDKKFVLEMLKLDSSEVRYVSDRLSNDVEVISTALKYAESDYDISSIKEALGEGLLTEMVNSRNERYEIAKRVEIEDFKNTLGCIDCDFEGLSDAEIEAMYDDFNELLANDDTYSSIYGETARQAFEEFMGNRVDLNLIDGLPKQFIAQEVLNKETHSEQFVLGAIDADGQGYYLSIEGGFIRGNDVFVSKDILDKDGNFLYDEFALNGLYFEYDTNGELPQEIIDVLRNPATRILNDDMKNFIEKLPIKNMENNALDSLDVKINQAKRENGRYGDGVFSIDKAKNNDIER